MILASPKICPRQRIFGNDMIRNRKYSVSKGQMTKNVKGIIWYLTGRRTQECQSQYWEVGGAMLKQHAANGNLSAGTFAERIASERMES